MSGARGRPKREDRNTKPRKRKGSITITLTRSPIGHKKGQRETARLLGLTKVGATVVRPDTPVVRGMVYKIRHLVEVEEA